MPDDDAEPSDTDVDAILHEFKGDHRLAIHALLHDLWMLVDDYADAVSLGYVRGEISAGAVDTPPQRRSDFPWVVVRISCRLCPRKAGTGSRAWQSNGWRTAAYRAGAEASGFASVACCRIIGWGDRSATTNGAMPNVWKLSRA